MTFRPTIDRPRWDESLRQVADRLPCDVPITVTTFDEVEESGQVPGGVQRTRAG